MRTLRTFLGYENLRKNREAVYLTHKRIRDLLRQYPVLKASLEAYEAQRQTILEATGVSPIVVAHKDKAPSNPTARKAERLEELENRYRFTLQACQAIELALDGMDRETRKIIKLRYFEGMRVNEIARKLHYGRQTIERRLRRGEGIVYVMAQNFPEVARVLQADPPDSDEPYSLVSGRPS